MLLLKAKFNNWELTNHCIIRSIFPRKSVTGEGIELEVEITIKQDVNYHLDQLVKILDTRGALGQLIISDEPERILLCKVKDTLEASSRFLNSELTLVFESPFDYWVSADEEQFTSDLLGSILIDNEGTAPSVPVFDVKFKDKSGFLGIVSPNGYVSLGSIDSKEREKAPETERVMNEEMDQADMADWERLSNIEHYIVDGDFTSKEFATYNKNGIEVVKATQPVNGHWSGWSYYKDFAPTEFDSLNFKLNSRLVLEDKSGSTRNTGCLMIIVTDNNNKPIMTTSLYCRAHNTNEVTAMCKVFDETRTVNGEHPSKVVKTFKFKKGFYGNIQMNKEGNTYTWQFNSNTGQTNSTVTQLQFVNEKFKVGDTVYIADRANTYYTGGGGSVSIPQFVKGRPHQIKQTRKRNNKTEYLVTYGGQVIAWVREGDLSSQSNGTGLRAVKSVSQTNNTTSPVYTYRGSNNNLKPSRVLIYGAVDQSDNPFTSSEITNVTVDVYHGKNKYYETENIFQSGDQVIIDNRSGEILHNGVTYQGLVDYDTRAFDIDPGPNELQVITSEWCVRNPDVTAYLQKRWR